MREITRNGYNSRKKYALGKRTLLKNDRIVIMYFDSQQESPGKLTL